MKWWDLRLNAPRPHTYRHPPVSRYREMNILSCQEDKVMRLPLFLPLFLVFHLCLSEAVGVVRQSRETFFFIIVVIAQNILVWVSEAPTLLCGPRASLKCKEFPPTVHLFRLALYMVLAGGEHDLIIPAVVFHPWTRIHPETPTPREEQRSLQTDLITLYRIYEYFTILPWFKCFYKINHLSLFLRNQMFLISHSVGNNDTLELLFATFSAV